MQQEACPYPQGRYPYILTLLAVVVHVRVAGEYCSVTRPETNPVNSMPTNNCKSSPMGLPGERHTLASATGPWR